MEEKHLRRGSPPTLAVSGGLESGAGWAAFILCGLVGVSFDRNHTPSGTVAKHGFGPDFAVNGRGLPRSTLHFAWLGRGLGRLFEGSVKAWERPTEVANPSFCVAWEPWYGLGGPSGLNPSFCVAWAGPWDALLRLGRGPRR